jgi:hypothetical protein
MEGIISTEVGNKVRSFWQRPEGKLGGVVAAGLVGGFLYVLYKILPFLITLTTNIITLGALALLLWASTYIIWNSRKAWSLLFRMAMRRLTGFIINIDPVAITEDYILKLRKRYETLVNQIAKLNGSKQRLQDEIARNEAEIERQKELAKAAQKRNQPYTQYTNQAGRLLESNKKYGNMLKQIVMLYTMLNKMQGASKVIIEDKNNLVKEKKREREVMRESYSAFMSAKNILAGNPDEMENFDRAMEFIQDDISDKLGEIDKFIFDSESLLQQIDLQNDVMSEKGAKLLEEWDQKIPMLLSEGNATSIDFEIVPSPEREPVPVKRKAKSDYDDILN